MDDSPRTGLPFLLLGFLLLLGLGAGFFVMRRQAALAAMAERRAVEAAAMAERLLAEKAAESADLRRELDALRSAATTLQSDAPLARAPVTSPDAMSVPVEPRTIAAADIAANEWLQRVHPERYAALTPAALHAIAELDLRGCEITDADLVHLGSLANLRSLELRGTAVTDAALVYLAALRLQTLSLRGTAVGAHNLPMLPATLQHLDLTDTRAGAEACRFLRPLPDLHTLKLNRLPIDDAGFDNLPALPRLRHLEIDGTQVTAAGVERLLQRYPLLVRIEVRRVRLPGEVEVLAELARRFPHVELVVDSGAPYAK